MAQELLIPHLTVRNAADTIAFYEQVLAATEVGPRLTTPSGKIMHTELKIGDNRVMVADATGSPAVKAASGGRNDSIRLCLEVDDVDACLDKAVKAGAELTVPATDQFYGYRSGTIVDPGGQTWIFTKQTEKLSHEEIQQRAANLMGGGEEAES